MPFNLKFKFDILLIFNMSLPPKEITSKCSFISIEGNIGSGKSTILRIIRQRFPQLMTLDEPLSEWQHVGENKNVDLLSLYYSDPNRWGFTFQLYTFMTRLKNWSQYSKITESGVKLSQRSLLSDRYIFANIMQDMNILNPMEYQLYLQYYKGMTQMSKIVDLNGVIYIKCTPQICSERIKKRNRQGQTSIPLDYLQKIHEKHQQWLVDDPEKELNVLVLNNTQPLDQITIVREISQWLRNFQSKQQLITSKTQSEDQQFLSFPNYTTQNQQMMSL